MISGSLMYADDGSEEPGAGVESSMPGVDERGVDQEVFLAGLDDGGGRFGRVFRRRRVLFLVGSGLVVAVIAVMLMIFLVSEEGADESFVVEPGDEVSIEFDASDNSPASDGVDGVSEVSAVVSEPAVLEAGETQDSTQEPVSAPWMLSAGSTDATALQPWAQSGRGLGQVPSGSAGVNAGSVQLGLVSTSYLYGFGPPVWHMVRAEIGMRTVASQSLTAWDHVATGVRLKDIERDLAWADTLFDSIEAPELLPQRVRSYGESIAGARVELDEALDILEEVNGAYGEGHGWDEFSQGERERVSRLVTQSFYAEVDAFGGVMQAYGCAICGELYRNPGSMEP